MLGLHIWFSFLLFLHLQLFIFLYFSLLFFSSLPGYVHGAPQPLYPLLRDFQEEENLNVVKAPNCFLILKLQWKGVYS